MKILVINCGSSSLKYQLINSETEDVLAKGICERIGIEGGTITYQKKGSDKIVKHIEQANHKESVQLVIDALTDKENGVVQDLSEIDAIGHRMVHGGEKFAGSALITDEMIKVVESCNDLAPLHNPTNIIGVNACKELMPNTPMVGVFDTAFHQTMGPEAYLYGVPYEYYTKYGVRKYGFHGTSHSYVSKRTAEILGLDYSKAKIIVCHLGSGASICAVDGGKSVETSMGLTPLMGLIMGTRSGDIDPGAIEYIAKKENLDLEGVMDVLNKDSGIWGMSGVSSDFRDVDDAVAEGNVQAKIAKDAYIHRIVLYIGAYIAVMNGVDAIAFTAGVGENDPEGRQQIMDHFGYMGVVMDAERNKARRKEAILSADESKVKVLLVPTNEELKIAQETEAIIQNL